MTNVSSSDAEPEMPRKGALIVGGTLFVLGWLCPLFVPVVAASNLPTAWKAVASGVLLIGLPELLIFAAIAILGHSGYRYLKGRLLMALKRYGPPEIVGPTRYHIGPSILVRPAPAPRASWSPTWDTCQSPGSPPTGLSPAAWRATWMFLSSLFVLGGEFWDKLRALFVHGAKARFPEPEDARPAPSRLH